MEEGAAPAEQLWREMDLGMDGGGSTVRCLLRGGAPGCWSWLSGCDRSCWLAASALAARVLRGRRSSAAPQLEGNEDWLPVEVSLLEAVAGHDEANVPVTLKFQICGRQAGERGTRAFQIPLSKISAVRRLYRARDKLPGVEFQVQGVRPRLQLLALPKAVEQGAVDCGEASSPTRADIHLQLLHAYVVAFLEEYFKEAHVETTAGVQPALLEWPLEGGRRESLAYLASALRGVTLIEPRDVGERARFCGVSCPICLEHWDNMPQHKPVVSLMCGHAFCEECLGGSVQHLRAACPSCRREFGPSANSELSSATAR